MGARIARPPQHLSCRRKVSYLWSRFFICEVRYARVQIRYWRTFIDCYCI